MSKSDFARGVELLEGAVRDACSRHDEWPERVAGGVQAAVSFFVENPRAVKSLAGDLPLDGFDPRYISVVERFSELLAAEAPSPRGPGGSTERALVGGIAAVIATHVRSGRLENLEAQAPELVYLALLPYLGFEEANRWAESTAAAD